MDSDPHTQLEKELASNLFLLVTIFELVLEEAGIDKDSALNFRADEMPVAGATLGKLLEFSKEAACKVKKFEATRTPH